MCARVCAWACTCMQCGWMSGSGKVDSVHFNTGFMRPQQKIFRDIFQLEEFQCILRLAHYIRVYCLKSI